MARSRTGGGRRKADPQGLVVLRELERNARVLCSHCGTRGELHRAKDGKCPPVRSWGVARPFPRYPRSSRKTAAAAAERYDRSLSRYWSVAATSYLPVA